MLNKNNISIFFICFNIIIILLFYLLINDKYQINDEYIKIQKYFNLSFYNNLKKKIKIAIYTYCLKNGGRARITSLLLKYLYNIKIFNVHLFTEVNKEENEYYIPNDIKRIIVKNNIVRAINKKRIDILIYQLNYANEIEILNKINNIKIIFYLHSSIFYWIYFNYTSFKLLYKAYTKSKYIVSIIPFENDYIFKNWGIRSILFSNFITYKYDRIFPSDLSDKSILMIGRGNNKLKRFQIGIRAMEYINQEIDDSKLIIISNLTGIENLQSLVNQIDLENNIKFIGYISSPEIFFKNISLHLFPSIAEAFPLVLCETKIYGIPNIVIGLDYISIVKGGTIIQFDDSPENLAKKVIAFFKDDKMRKQLGIDARKSMKKYKNDFLIYKWTKLILNIFNGDLYYQNLINKDIIINQKKSINILKNQLNFINMRIKSFKEINIKNFLNFSFMENL